MPETRVVNKHKERGTKYIGRGSGFGNPYEIGKDGSRGEVCYKHEVWLRAWVEGREYFENAVRYLKEYE